MSDGAATDVGQAEPVARRRDTGLRAHLSGASAERSVVALYDRKGYDVLETRWRGKGGEIDLILAQHGMIVFTEVKKARSFDAARASLRPAQMERIHAAASEYLAFCPDGQLSDVRFDLAVTDTTGRVEITENAFGHF